MEFLKRNILMHMSYKKLFLGNRSMKLQRRGIDNKNIIIPLLCSNISGYNQLPEELKKNVLSSPAAERKRQMVDMISHIINAMLAKGIIEGF